MVTRFPCFIVTTKVIELVVFLCNLKLNKPNIVTHLLFKEL